MSFYLFKKCLSIIFLWNLFIILKYFKYEKSLNFFMISMINKYFKFIANLIL